MTFIRNITFRFYFILVLIYVLSIEVPEALYRQLFLLYLGICLFGSLCLLYMVHALASLWVTKKWTMHNTRMEKQINLINTFKMTMIFPFFSFLSHIWTWKGLFWVTLTLYKTNPSRTVSWRENTTKRGIIWFFVTFIYKVLKFSFLDGGQFGGHFEFINPQFF